MRIGRSDLAAGIRLTLAAAEAALPAQGRRSVSLFRHGSLELKLYAPRGEDTQTPHTRDEVYVVMSGSGRFRAGGAVMPFGPGDALFVPAGMAHRFEDFGDDLQVWVVFYGPEGGEANAPEAGP